MQHSSPLNVTLIQSKNLDEAISASNLKVTKKDFPQTQNAINHCDDYTFFMIGNIDNEVVGIAKLSIYEKSIYVDFMETSENHRNIGIGKQLLTKIFEVAKAENKQLKTTGVSDDGIKYLTHISRKLGGMTVERQV